MVSKKVSVIIPCCNSEKYVAHTLGLILNQLYKNIEVICVNDGSSDGTLAILQQFSENNENVKVVNLEENRGLFAARRAGASAAEGDYILFLDSDDEVTPGWVGALVHKAEQTNADLVLGDVQKKGDRNRRDVDIWTPAFQNLDPLRLQDLDTDGRGMLDLLMQMHGLCSHYHYIWNKLIRRDLWLRCADDFEKLRARREHLVMGEDIAFSATLYCHAQKVCNIHNEYYIYCYHSGQSVESTNLPKFQKNVGDLVAVFDYLQELLTESGLYEQYAKEYLQFKQRLGFVYMRIAKHMQFPQDTVEYVKEAFAQDKIENKKHIQTDFFFSLMTNRAPIYNEYQKMMQWIFSDEVKVVSFDVFDTLVCRPFADPADIFVYLNEAFAKQFGVYSYVDFSSQRRVAEDKCHKLQKVVKPGIEEPTLDEIYDVLADNYGYDRQMLEPIKELEMENEVRFAYPRKFGIELLELAKEAGKKVILSSDMYLPRGCIEKILEKCGVRGYEKLYLSSELHLTKHYGTMYPVILRDYKDIAKPEEILHIGDNYRSDVENPKKYGLKAMHLPRAMGLLQGRNPGIYTGESFDKIFKIGDRYRDMSLAYGAFSGLRSLCAVAANEIFDFPYVSFNKKSDLNADPRFVGYYTLGMHIYSVARWLIENTRGKGYRKIHFAARDGYLVKQAYDILAEGEDGLPESNYIRVSRKAFAIADIRSFADMHSVVHKLNFIRQSPDSLFDLFAPVMSEESKKRYSEYREKNEARCLATFTERTQFDMYIVQFYNEYLQDARFSEYEKNLAEYFGGIVSENDVLFDIGYSGRIELALNKLLHIKPKSFYIHTNTDAIFKRLAVSEFENSTFYNYKPMVTGIIREHVFSEMCPSTIGYTRRGGEVQPVYEKYDIDYPTRFVTELVQRSAVKFVQDVKNLFGHDALRLACRMEDVSRPFEYYMHYSRNFDRCIFVDSEFEDDFGEGHSFSGLEFWNRALGRISGEAVLKGGAPAAKEPAVPSLVRKRGKIMRALYFFLYDRKTFRQKLKNRLHRGNKK